MSDWSSTHNGVPFLRGHSWIGALSFMFLDFLWLHVYSPGTAEAEKNFATQQSRLCQTESKGQTWQDMTNHARTPMPKSDLHLWDGFFKFRNGLACISLKRIRIHDPSPIHNKILCIYIIHIIIKCATYIHYITLHNTTQPNLHTYVYAYIHACMHGIALHCMAWHCIALHILHYITLLHCMHYIRYLRYISYISHIYIYTYT
jgi:hypothetical protein